MKRNVMLEIKGLFGDGTKDDAAIGSLVPAEYYVKNGTHYLFYTERPDETEEEDSVRTRMKIGESGMELVRSGSVATRMVFEEGREHEADYRTPYGRFLLEIGTKQFLVEQKESDMKVTIDYTLKIDGQHISDSRVTIHVRDMFEAAATL